MRSGNSELSSGARILHLREVRASDCERLYAWANAPEVRRNSLRTEPIDWPTHVSWFTRKLADPDCFLFIAEDETGDPIGQVRFDIQDTRAVIGISLAASQCGKGFGSTLIALGTERLFASTSVENIDAWIKPDNMASLYAFRRAGYAEAGIRLHQGEPLCHYFRTRQHIFPTNLPDETSAISRQLK